VGLARLSDEPFGAVAAGAIEQRWTRDPFDRLIVAQAELAGAELVTKDQSIRTHYRGARWG
jgi:PIN domain nuclease of toxin-antitoxin system